ncbi:hypothetical protein [Desulfopila sp. IMCC35008]|uniref:hypothetical protein n=1 Tax=Desulfopila sp. IMCC35008 TaxID=2653858 RepID=UPI0013D78F95|nr:hypothetical protein [Desulfopila sp. IMCC35008]
MSSRKIFKQKMEAEVARAQTELARFRAMGMGFTAEAKDRHDEHVAELEQQLDATKARLRDVTDANEDVWESLKDSVENTWSTLHSALQEAVENFKAELPPDGLHGSDKEDFPSIKKLKQRLAEKMK